LLKKLYRYDKKNGGEKLEEEDRISRVWELKTVTAR